MKTTSNKTEPSQPQSQSSRGGVSVKGVLLTSLGGTSKRGKGQCQHARGGYCSLHGWGATKKFKPVINYTTGPGGKQIKKYSKKIYYECEEGATVRQSQLSFSVRGEAVTTELTSNMNGGGSNKNYSDFSSTTAGQ